MRRSASTVIAVGCVGSLLLATVATTPAAAQTQPGPQGEQSTSPASAPPESRTDLATRGDVRTGVRIAVATPSRGQTTISRVIVTSKKAPTVAVSAAGKKPGTRKITVVSGVRKLSTKRSGSGARYAVTTVAIKPRVKGAKNADGKVALRIAGRKLKVQSTREYQNGFTRRAKGEMCRNLSAFDLANQRAKARVTLNDRIYYGREMPGFGSQSSLGMFALLQACQGKTIQSFRNAMTGKRKAVKRSSAPMTKLSSAPTKRSLGSGGAVVLVSGFLSQTPFTSPGNVCTASGMSAGGTWSAMQTALAGDGFPVYTAPETAYTYNVPNAPVPVAIDPSTMGLGTCGPQLPASMTLNTAGDFDTNSSILAGFLNYLNTTYGVSNIWLVGHSDGGLWSRGAMDYASFMPGISVESITTIDTPWTGSFLANTAADQLTCSDLDIECHALADVLNYFSSALAQGDALNEMDSTYMVSWNQRMAGVPGSTPFYAASAIGLNDPDTFGLLASGTGTNPFYNPNDIAVGIASQQAQGLVANGTISNLACFATIPGLHTEIPSSLLDTGQDVDLINSYGSSGQAVTTNPMTITNVTNVLNGAPPAGACPSANYEQSGEYAPGQFGSWPDN